MISLRLSSIRLILSLLITVTYTSTLHAKLEGYTADKIPNSTPEILSVLTDNTPPLYRRGPKFKKPHMKSDMLITHQFREWETRSYCGV